MEQKSYRVISKYRLEVWDAQLKKYKTVIGEAGYYKEDENFLEIGTSKKNRKLFAYDDRNKRLVSGPTRFSSYVPMDGAFCYTSEGTEYLLDWEQKLTELGHDVAVYDGEGINVLETDAQKPEHTLWVWDINKRRLSKPQQNVRTFSICENPEKTMIIFSRGKSWFLWLPDKDVITELGRFVAEYNLYWKYDIEKDKFKVTRFWEKYQPEVRYFDDFTVNDAKAFFWNSFCYTHIRAGINRDGTFYPYLKYGKNFDGDVCWVVSEQRNVRNHVLGTVSCYRRCVDEVLRLHFMRENAVIHVCQKAYRGLWQNACLQMPDDKSFRLTLFSNQRKVEETHEAQDVGYVDGKLCLIQGESNMLFISKELCLSRFCQQTEITETTERSSESPQKKWWQFWK